MTEIDGPPQEEHRFLLSNLSPGRAQKRFALAIVVGLLVALYLISGPLAGIQLGASNAFVAMYATAMFVTDAITAILLYAQFSILRSRATLVIASGYLFAALIVVLYFLAFPGVFGPGYVIGGMQTGGWFYVTWHCGFAIFVIAYTLSKSDAADRRPWRGKVWPAIVLSIALTAALAATIGYVCTRFHDNLPRTLIDPLRFSPDWPYFIGAPIVTLSSAAIVVLWIRRRTVLDLWLMVVLCLYLVEVPLSWYPAPTRFSVGWYAVRVIGFLSSTIVLTVLLYEITTLYARLLGAVLGRRREREARLMTGDAVAASIAHEIRQPLTAMVTTADAGLRFVDRAMPNLEKAKEAFRRIAADGHRAGALVSDIRSNFKSDVSDRTSFDVNELIQEALRLGGSELDRHHIAVRTEPSQTPPLVKGNRVQVQQVLLNLIMNAIDAMSGVNSTRVLSVRAAPCDGDQVLISVADTGTGIAPSDNERMFSPLFTTKPDGMGMGLSICRAIVEAHDGRLWVTPNIPQGAVFQFTLQASA